jgi:hypothetical protein
LLLPFDTLVKRSPSENPSQATGKQQLLQLHVEYLTPKHTAREKEKVHRGLSLWLEEVQWFVAALIEDKMICSASVDAWLDATRQKPFLNCLTFSVFQSRPVSLPFATPFWSMTCFIHQVLAHVIKIKPDCWVVPVLAVKYSFRYQTIE